MILGFPRAKQGLSHTKHRGAGGIILWALLTVFLVLTETHMAYHNLSCSVREVDEVKFYTYHVPFRTQFLSLILIKFSIIFSHYWWGCVEIWNCQEEWEEGLCVYDYKLWSAELGATLRDGESMAIRTNN